MFMQKHFGRWLISPWGFALLALVLSGCANDDDGDDGNPSGKVESNASTFNIPLQGAQEVPPVQTTASGNTNLQIDLDTGAITGSAVTTNLTNATMAHIHSGFAGQNGPILITLERNGDAWQLPANSTLDATQLETLNAGGLYVNVHTAANPGGEIRGQILPESVEVISVALSGAEEVPPVTTQNSARAGITLDSNTRRLTLRMMTMGLDDATAAHIHRGFAGENGPIEIGLTRDPLNPALWFVDTTELSEANYARLRAGGLYVNVHTPAYSGGEVRGQITPAQIVEITSFQILGQVPASDSTVTQLPTEIALDFSSAVNSASIVNTAFQILRAGGDGSFVEGNEAVVNITSAQVSGSDPNRVILNISGNQSLDDLYQITVNDSILSAVGVQLDGNKDGAPGGSYQRAFTVAAAPSLQPTLSSIQSTIFTPMCANVGCHGRPTPQEGLLLTEGDAYAHLVNVASRQVPSLMRVLPGNPNNSYLIHKLEGTAAVGDRMPEGGPYLTPDQIAVIRAWITAGAPNN